MSFEISIIQLITVCAVMNVFVFVFLLLEKKENRRANRFLSLTILSTCLTFTPFILDFSIWNTYQWLPWLPLSLSFWIGPAFYFYIKKLTIAQNSFQKKDLWHFSPILLSYFHSVYHAVFADANPWPWFHSLAEILGSMAILSVMIYLFLSLRLVKRYQRSILNKVSNTEMINLRWVNQLIFVSIGSFVFMVVFFIALMTIDRKYLLFEWYNPRVFGLLIYAGVLYWLSISGFKQAQTHQIISTEESAEQDSSEYSEVIQKLSIAIESHKLYRNPELSLSDLSKFMNISERTISNAINQELGKNFFQLINEYRVEEIKELLKDPKKSHIKILSLAFDAGFNSKSSFNRVFKSLTGQTPKNYKSENT